MDGTEQRLCRLVRQTRHIKWILGIGFALVLTLNLVLVYWTWLLYARMR
jgi:hypothetical protein